MIDESSRSATRSAVTVLTITDVAVWAGSARAAVRPIAGNDQGTGYTSAPVDRHERRVNEL